jgi:hypothetical protein
VRVYIGAVFLGEQIFIDPALATFGQNDGPVKILIQSLLIDTTTQVINLPGPHLPDGLAQFGIRNPHFFRNLGESGRLESSGSGVNRHSKV